MWAGWSISGAIYLYVAVIGLTINRDSPLHLKLQVCLGYFEGASSSIP